jgi:hypothetical protein
MSNAVAPEGFTGSRERWLAGLCPCCGAEMNWWPSTEPQTVADGVVMCGRCIENEHHLRPPGFLPLLLAALLPSASEN